MNVQSLLNRLRGDSGDASGRRWSNDMWLSWVNEGLCEAYAVRPEMFAQTCRIALAPGSRQCIEDCCQILEVTGVYERSGRRVGKIAAGKNKDAEVDYPLRKATCLVGDAAMPAEYTVQMDKGMKHCFSIWPEIEADGEFRAQLSIACRPAPITMSTAGDIGAAVNCSNLGPILHYAMASARRSGTPSPGDVAASVSHMTMFFNAIGWRGNADARSDAEFDPPSAPRDRP